MKKLSDLEESERNAVTETIWANVNLNSNHIETIVPLSLFGICGKCKSFEFAESEFNIEHAKCIDFNKMLSEKKPIVNCSCYQEKGVMTLRDMETIGWILDFNTRKVGFCNGKED
jgi:hypothetical protein